MPRTSKKSLTKSRRRSKRIQGGYFEVPSNEELKGSVSELLVDPENMVEQVQKDENKKFQDILEKYAVSHATDIAHVAFDLNKLSWQKQLTLLNEIQNEALLNKNYGRKEQFTIEYGPDDDYVQITDEKERNKYFKNWTGPLLILVRQRVIRKGPLYAKFAKAYGSRALVKVASNRLGLNYFRNTISKQQAKVRSKSRRNQVEECRRPMLVGRSGLTRYQRWFQYPDGKFTSDMCKLLKGDSIREQYNNAALLAQKDNECNTLKDFNYDLPICQTSRNKNLVSSAGMTASQYLAAYANENVRTTGNKQQLFTALALPKHKGPEQIEHEEKEFSSVFNEALKGYELNDVKLAAEYVLQYFILRYCLSNINQFAQGRWIPGWEYRKSYYLPSRRDYSVSEITATKTRFQEIKTILQTNPDSKLHKFFTTLKSLDCANTMLDVIGKYNYNEDMYLRFVSFLSQIIPEAKYKEIKENNHCNRISRGVFTLDLHNVYGIGAAAVTK